MSRAIEVRDASDLRKYRTEIPNMVLEMGLTPHALALYLHLKRTAGQDGVCFKSTRTLADNANMSIGKVSEARTELEERGLILVERPTDKGKAIRVQIRDIWPQNFQHFAQRSSESPACSQYEHVPEKPENRVQNTNAACSQYERRNKPTEEVNSTEIVPPTTSTELSLSRGERSAPRPAPGEKKKETPDVGDSVVEQQKRLAFNLLRAYCDQLHEIRSLTDGERGQLVKQVNKAIRSGEETVTIKRGLSRMVVRRDEGVRLQFKDALKDIHDAAHAQEKRDKQRESSGPRDIHDIIAEREEYRASIGLPPLSSLA